MNDALAMSMLDCVAYLHEEREALRDACPDGVAVLRNLHDADQLHGEVGAASIRDAGIEHLRDVWMVHHRQCLALRREANDDCLGIHPKLDDFEGNLATQRRDLLGAVDGSPAALAEIF